jgi:hypothetical protein
LAEQILRVLPQLTRIAHVREVSAGNGHGAGNGQKLR